ncbi:DnaJ domain-containing protein [Phaeosphaeriaceae sp. PMI808]|nr:DnaJ domain-containing protein [Phaeosphaeriaceae sp. PMI808]
MRDSIFPEPYRSCRCPECLYPPSSRLHTMPTGAGSYSRSPPAFQPSTNPHPAYFTEEIRPSARAWAPPPPPSYTYSSYREQGCRFRSSSQPSAGSSRGHHYRTPEPSYRPDTFDPPPRTYRPRTPPGASGSRSPPSYNGKKPKTCLYTVLEISRSASQDEVKKAYRKLSLKHHPDRVSGDEKERATDKMAEINLANDVLGNQKKRIVYDITGCLPSSNL